MMKKTAQSPQPAQPTTQPAQPQADPRTDESAATQELESNWSYIENMAMGWISRHGEEACPYIDSPSEATLSQLTQAMAGDMLASIIGAGEDAVDFLPVVGGYLSKVLKVYQIKSVNRSTAKSLLRLPPIKSLFTRIAKFCTDNLRLAAIPDNISRLHPLLLQRDVPDAMLPAIQDSPVKIQQKFPGKPDLVQKFLLIMLRIKDSQALVETQRAIVASRQRQRRSAQTTTPTTQTQAPTQVPSPTPSPIPEPSQSKPPDPTKAMPRDVIARLYQAVNAKNSQSANLFRQWMSNPVFGQALLDVMEALGTDFIYYRQAIQRYLVEPSKAAEKTPTTAGRMFDLRMAQGTPVDLSKTGKIMRIAENPRERLTLFVNALWKAYKTVEPGVQWKAVLPIRRDVCRQGFSEQEFAMLLEQVVNESRDPKWPVGVAAGPDANFKERAVLNRLKNRIEINGEGVGSISMTPRPPVSSD